MVWYRRHPLVALVLVNVILVAFFGGAMELFLRSYLPFNPGYYTGIAGTRELTYPFGRIPQNADGFPDDDFDLTKPHRVGYFGDSVTYGIGAGYGYRISELLQSAYPDYEHLNLGGIGLSISNAEINHCVRLAKRYSLDHTIYLFNLNDILPDQAASGHSTSTLRLIQDHIISHLDWLRGSSFLYTYLRTAAKTFLEARGVGFHGYSAFELYPHTNAQVLQQTAQRINAFHDALARIGIPLSLVILPYEMQISQEAEKTYKSLGVHWEDGFIDRGPQQLLLHSLAKTMPVFDAYFAFVDPSDSITARARNRLGEFFVYNRGDKLDWNHPNRAGHRQISLYLAREHILGPSQPLEPPQPVALP